MKQYDVIIIGGGPAGLVASKLLVAFGKKVALVEANKLGGDCTHTGCVPSKTLLKAAKAVYDTNHLEQYGIGVEKLQLETSKVFSHVKTVVDEIYAHETPEVFKQAGVDVIEGKASFQSEYIIEVENCLYKAKNFIIATGSSANTPNIQGVDAISYLTNENIFELKKVPKSLIVVGTGVIAIEMATAFNRLGCEVTIVSRSEGILKGNDEELTQILYKQLQNEGVQFIQNIQFKAVTQKKNVKLLYEKEGLEECIKASEILFATGRTPNTNLNLDKAGVVFDNKGINVNEYLQTSQKHIYAMGDVSTPYKFTHIAEQEAIVAGSNIALPLKKKIDYKNIGWCIYSDPELAHIGLTFEQAKAKYGNSIICQEFEYKNSDRGYTDMSRVGKIKVVVTPKGAILGASILGERAGELIHQLQLAKTYDISFDKLSKMVYIYPTFSDIIKQSSKQFYIAKLLNNPWLKLLKRVSSLFKGN